MAAKYFWVSLATAYQATAPKLYQSFLKYDGVNNIICEVIIWAVGQMLFPVKNAGGLDPRNNPCSWIPSFQCIDSLE